MCKEKCIHLFSDFGHSDVQYIKTIFIYYLFFN